MRCVRVWATDARGNIAAEFAIVIPAVLVVLTCCIGAIQAAAQQVSLTDAAADAARTLARGDSADLAASRARQVAGANLSPSLSSRMDGDFVCVTLVAPATFPFAATAGVTIRASSCALAGGL